MNDELVIRGLFAGYLSGLGKQAASQEDIDNFETILKSAHAAMQKEAALPDTLGMLATGAGDFFRNLLYKLTRGKGAVVPKPKVGPSNRALAQQALANPNIGKLKPQQPRRPF